jgi:hypothetical protein
MSQFDYAANDTWSNELINRYSVIFKELDLLV